jgi:hypothetical protein
MSPTGGGDRRAKCSGFQGALPKTGPVRHYPKARGFVAQTIPVIARAHA